MKTAATRWEEARRRRRDASLGVSIAAHVIALLLLDIDLPEEPEPVMQIELVRIGDPEKEPGPPPAPTVSPEPRPRVSPSPRRPRPPSTAPPVADVGEFVPAPEPGPPVPAPAPAPPISFRDWQRGRPSPFMPSGTPLGSGGGRVAGDGALDVRGRDRCEPSPDRQFERLYLLFDSSGSMTSIRRAEALSCAHQYARAAIERGATIVVANFAKDTIFTQETHDMIDVEAALRGVNDSSATVLPTRALQPFVDRQPDADAEMVIISDGWFDTSQEVLVWYRYFLEMNPENRGTMYTVGTPGLRESVRRLRGIGYDVYMYQQIHRADAEN